MQISLLVGLVCAVIRGRRCIQEHAFFKDTAYLEYVPRELIVVHQNIAQPFPGGFWQAQACPTVIHDQAVL